MSLNLEQSIIKLRADMEQMWRRYQKNSAIVLYTNDVSSPPTEAQLTAIFGTPATAGVGKMFLLADAGSTSAEYLCISDGATWQILVLTKAV